MPTHDTVWKLNLNPGLFITRSEFTIGTTRHAEILRVDFQAPALVTWVRLDPMQPPIDLEIALVGTGEQIPDGFDKYINTFFANEFVFHAFTKEML